MTKGPWIVDVTETGIYLVDGNEEDVAEFWHSGRHGNSVSEQQAIEHATLCAAAPKLLEALEKLVTDTSAMMEVYEPGIGDSVGHTNYAWVLNRLDAARAAIVAAGETP